MVTRARLLRAGVTLGEIRQRLAAGGLLLEYPAIYRVGHRAPSVEAGYLAAVWACGEGAMLSGRAAARLLSVLRRRRITLPITRRHLSYWDVRANDWRVAPGCYGVMVGSSSRDIALRGRLAAGGGRC